MSELVYLAYGSNLHPLRLRERVPSARVLDRVGLPGYRMEFRKRSVDGSAKCDLHRTERRGDRAWGVLYRMAPEQKPVLDRIEGAGHGYREVRLQVQVERTVVECFTYMAEPSHIEPDLKPYHWYKSMVVLGARFFDLPEHYIRSIEAVPSVNDPDPLERSRYEHLVYRLINHRPG